MNYEAWQQSVPEAITADALWQMRVYRLALFLGDVAWHDVTKLAADRRTHGLSDQLYRAIGSVSANIAEGYGRGTGKDRARFYEYALGSARESRDWYYKARHLLGETVAAHRLDTLAEIIRHLLVIIPAQRQGTLREPQAAYDTAPSNLLFAVPLPDEPSLSANQHAIRNTQQERNTE